MADGVFTPYSTVSPFFGALPAWVPVEEQERIASYGTYEEVYWNAPQTFKLVLRGTDTKAIYLPSARIIINTINRYTAPKMNFKVDPAFGTPGDQTVMQTVFQQLFARERFRSKFASEKRMGLVRGDWLFHVLGDPLKPQGSRLRIVPVHPASYFPVYADNDLDRLIKVHLAEMYDLNGQSVVKRQTYTKNDNGTIQSETIVVEATDWSTDGPKVVPGTESTSVTLPPAITAIPVYHFANREETGNPYGSSEIRGIERLFSGMNQSISDEDLSLAMDGLGVYWTKSGSPVDEDGNDVEWIIGPGRIIDNMDEPLNRLDGVKTTVPYGEHIDRLWNFAKDAAGANDAAMGNVDVQVAESGVALALRMGPVLAEADEKELGITDKLTQMFFDLKSWFAAYEGVGMGDALCFPSYGEKLPRNRKAEVEMLTAMMSTETPIISAVTAREHLAAYGFQFAADEVLRVAQEMQLTAESKAAGVDPFGTRLDGEAGTDTGADSGDAGTEGA